jgi:putative transposase
LSDHLSGEYYKAARLQRRLEYSTTTPRLFYNRIRKQARLGYLSPAAFNQQYYAKQMAD